MKKFIVLSVVCMAISSFTFAQPWSGSSTSALTTRTGNVVIGNTALEGSFGTSRVLQIKGNGTWLSMISTEGAGTSFSLGHTQFGSNLYSWGLPIAFWTSPTPSSGHGERMRITGDGNVGIGTTLAQNPFNYKLAVNGTIGAKEVRIENTSNAWADYVFENDYRLMPLSEVESFIKENKHLPEIPSKAEVAEYGHKLGEMDVLLLKKVEELTLYIIELKKEISSLNGTIDQLKSDKKIK